MVLISRQYETLKYVMFSVSIQPNVVTKKIGNVQPTLNESKNNNNPPIKL